jgi:peptidoglycan/xylan/chitin deacetylase (PgdA/CDA1 family)
MPVSEKQIAAILALPPPQRYDHFIKKVVGWRKVWGLYEDGWAMSETADGEPVFPLWPEKEYAELCATADWAGYEAREIELDEFMTDLLPMLEERGIHPGVFFVPGQGSIDIKIDQLQKDLQQELDKYE